MTIGERIKMLRLSLSLTQKAFGERILISAPSVTRIETGENNPSDQTKRLICQEFRVSRAWLENGIGDMLLPEDEDEAVTRLMLGESERAKHLMRTIAGLPPEAVDLIYSFARALIQRDPDAPHPTDKGGP